MKKYARTLVSSSTLMLLSLMVGGGSASSTVQPSPESQQMTSFAPVEVPLEHPISLQDAMIESATFPEPVIGFGYTNDNVIGQFFPTENYTASQFAESFALEHGSAPQIDTFLTAPAQSSNKAGAEQPATAETVPVTAEPFEAQSSDNGKLQRDMQRQAELAASTTIGTDADTPSLRAAAAGSWFPLRSEVRTVSLSNGTAALQSMYTWNGNEAGQLGNLDPNFGLEVEVNLQGDGRYVGDRPNCLENINLENPVLLDDVKKAFWAQNQDWASWSVTVPSGQDLGTLQAYADYNDLFDDCNGQSIAVGIGRPQNIPNQGDLLYGFTVSIIAPQGNVARNLVERSGLQPVAYDCEGFPWNGQANTDCMAISQEPYPDQSQNYFPTITEAGAGNALAPTTRIPVYTPNACWSLTTGQVPFRFDCSFS